MKRREFIKLGACGAAVALGPKGLLGMSHPRNADERPNLLIIHTDEHNFRTLGCYRETLPPEQAFMWGEEAVAETPHIDRLAEEGALCTNFYATSPICSPSRGSFATGLYPMHHDVLHNNIPMRDGLATFASVLHDHGYATGYAGKWHLDGTGKPQWAPERKFGFTDNRFMFNRGHWKQLEDTPDGPRVKARKDGEPTYDVKGADEQSFTTDWLADKTVEFITAHRDEPFCYMLSIPDPHGPDTVRAPYDTMYRDREFTMPRTASKSGDDLPDWAQPRERANAHMDKYLGMVKCIDDNVGKLIDALESNGLLDKTIVVFTADHGDMRGEHGRQNKTIPYEGSAKIPFVVRYPARIKPGTQIDEVMSCVDFLPTILGLMDVEAAVQCDGHDASELFTGKPVDWDDVAFIRGPKTTWVSALTKRYKLVLCMDSEPWLIDRKEDPDELVNFCAERGYGDVVRGLAGKLKSYGVACGDPCVNSEKVQADLATLLEQSKVGDTA